MKIYKLLILTTTVLVIQGCNTVHYVKMAATPSSDQKVVYNDGKETIVSQKKHFVSLAPYHELNTASGKTSFVLFVQNLGEVPITVTSGKVSILFEGKTKEWASNPINVLSYNDMILEVEEEESSERTAAAWAAALGAVSASMAATSTTSTYSSGTAYGTYNSSSYGSYSYNPYTMNTTGNMSGSYSGYSTSTTYDPAKAQALANQNSLNFQNNLKDITAKAQSNRQLIERLVMKSQTIGPGQSHGGLVVADTRAMDQKVEGDFKIVVSVDEEKYEFAISRSLYVNKNKTAEIADRETDE